jgi:hypothetical protein
MNEIEAAHQAVKEFPYQYMEIYYVYLSLVGITQKEYEDNYPVLQAAGIGLDRKKPKKEK